MTKSNDFETDLLGLIFQAVAIANIADDAAASPLTNLQVSLHTGDPGDAGNQTTSEATYTSYARVAVARTAGGWSVSGDTASPVAAVDFPQASGGSNTITHFAVGTDSTGTGKILYSGTVSPNISVTTGVTPRLTVATSISED